jgi:hypothetical protein
MSKNPITPLFNAEENLHLLQGFLQRLEPLPFGAFYIKNAQTLIEKGWSFAFFTPKNSITGTIDPNNKEINNGIDHDSSLLPFLEETEHARQFSDDKQNKKWSITSPEETFIVIALIEGCAKAMCTATLLQYRDYYGSFDFDENAKRAKKISETRRNIIFGRKYKNQNVNAPSVQKELMFNVLKRFITNEFYQTHAYAANARHGSDALSQISDAPEMEKTPVFIRPQPPSPRKYSSQRSSHQTSKNIKESSFMQRFYNAVVEEATKASPPFTLNERGYGLSDKSKENIKEALGHLAVIPDQNGNIIDNYALDRIDEIYQLLEDHILSPATDYFASKKLETARRQRTHEITMGRIAILRQAMPML